MLYKQYTFEAFTVLCDKQQCPRQTMYHEKRCLTESKRKNCFRLYNQKLEKDKLKSKSKTDPLWEEVKSRVRNQYGEGCHLFNALSNKERSLIAQKGLLNHGDFKTIDGAHIIPKGPFPEHKYKVENVILIKRLFHSRLEIGCDPITGEYVGKDKCMEWYLKVWNHSREKSLTNKGMLKVIANDEVVELRD